MTDYTNSLGRKAEALIEKQIETSGWHHVGDSQFGAGGAPMIRGESGDQIRPDYSVMKAGERVWVEVKGKSEPVPFEHVPRHGIPRENWEHYNRVADASGDPCWLFIYEQSTGVVLCEDIDELPVADERIKESYPDDDPYGEDMVFFNKVDFRVKEIAQAHYPERFFGQDKLPLANIKTDRDTPLFPGSDLGESGDGLDSRLTDFVTDGGAADE